MTNTPPCKPCVAFFRGKRTIRNQQTMSLAELVQVRWVEIGRTKRLGVALFGKARVYALDKFQGEWVILPDMAAWRDVQKTLLDALDTEAQEWGDCAELVNARRWLEGKLQNATG